MPMLLINMQLPQASLAYWLTSILFTQAQAHCSLQLCQHTSTVCCLSQLLRFPASLPGPALAF